MQHKSKKAEKRLFKILEEWERKENKEREIVVISLIFIYLYKNFGGRKH